MERVWSAGWMCGGHLPIPTPFLPFSQPAPLRFDEPEDGGRSCFVSFVREEREVDAAARGLGGGEGLGRRRGVSAGCARFGGDSWRRYAVGWPKCAGDFLGEWNSNVKTY